LLDVKKRIDFRDNLNRSPHLRKTDKKQRLETAFLFIEKTDDVCSIFSEANTSPKVKSEPVAIRLPKAAFEAKCIRGFRY
jgi:hypothetical protein